MKFNAYIGYDSRQPLAYAVAVRSLLKHNPEIDVRPILLADLQGRGIYDRKMTKKDGQMFDVISGAPMSTEFAISRFFIPYLAGYSGWSLFTDSDFLFRVPLDDLFAQADPSKAVMCVKHNYAPKEGVKMDGQAQTLYDRKNWSSMMLINNAHPKNSILEPKLLNALPGRDFHAFSWLDDDDIGALDVRWNWLEGHNDQEKEPAAVVHFTRGTPDMKGYENTPYSDEWFKIADEINMIKG